MHHKTKAYKVKNRPTKQGEFLYFPHGYKKGGRGYVISRTIKQRLESPALQKQDIPLSVLAIGSIFLPFMIGLKGFVPMAIFLGAWYFLIKKREEQRRQKLLKNVRLAPFRLTKARYNLEYASQFNRRALEIGFVGGVLFAVGSVCWVLHHFFSSKNLLWPFICAAVSILWTVYIYHWLNLKTLAFKTSVMAGDPVDCPIPTEDWRPVPEDPLPEETDETSMETPA